ncbi:hypothetical protein [Aurantiacibacter rhizosphaerae]|uniref:Uncharacterized protein n=1 Tax=Aurantiacibacter rhizosphaerae TaxID=2691582 RepID=A0A844XAQ6_9SPHN|nr:hypothetical protein [Aurantiacibacter rhizosphaerae]MWV27477.1 hypothetical protein [Aurantiacibacter rhizosphaerae]
MRLFFGGFLLLCAASPTLAQDQSSRFDLVCLGAGAANRQATATVNAWDNQGGFGSANVVGNRSVPFDDQVNLWIEGEEGRLRMPRAMLPAIRGGEDGWFRVSSIEITPDEITGSIRVNPLNNPRLRIDRMTGAISISGKAGDYSGRCQRYDPETVQRAF